jgi:hypothetical protein
MLPRLPWCLLLLPLAVALGFPSASPAQAPEPSAAAAAAAPAPCPPNAALLYWRAWNGRYPTVWEPTFLEQEFRSDWNFQPTPQVASVLEGAQPDILMVLKAARMERCDWGINLLEEGYEAPLPHIAKIRTTARVLIADSRRLAANGDVAGACERLAALLLMAHQLRNEKTVYVVRFAQSIAVDMTTKEMKRLAATGKLDPLCRAILAEALAKVSGPDPFGMRDALRQEPIVLNASIRRLCKGPNAGDTFFAKFAPRATPDERAQSGLQQMDEASLYTSAERLAALYADVEASWDLPEPIKLMRDIDNQRRAGDYGGVAVLVNSDLPQLRRIVLIVENEMKNTLSAVNGEQATPATPAPGPSPAK